MYSGEAYAQAETRTKRHFSLYLPSLGSLRLLKKCTASRLHTILLCSDRRRQDARVCTLPFLCHLLLAVAVTLSEMQVPARRWHGAPLQWSNGADNTGEHTFDTGPCGPSGVSRYPPIWVAYGPKPARQLRATSLLTALLFLCFLVAFPLGSSNHEMEVCCPCDGARASSIHRGGARLANQHAREACSSRGRTPSLFRGGELGPALGMLTAAGRAESSVVVCWNY